MPIVKVVYDGLWHCLCLAFEIPLFRKPSSCRRAQFGCDRKLSPNGQRSTFLRSSFAAQRSSSRCNQKRCLQTGFFCARLGTRDVHGGGNRDTPWDYTNLTTQNAYEELRRASVQADALRVHALVELLVRDRHEKANPRLYQALLLANADPYHGSPAEVRRLLREMEDEDIIPDSATYHAVLKVLAIHPDYLLRQDVLEELRQRWFTLSNDGWHDMLIGLIRDRELEVVVETLEVLHRESIKIHPWLHDLLIYTFCDAEDFEEALRLMRSRVASGELLISANLWYHFLDTASRALHYDATFYAWRNRVETKYLNPPSGICYNVLSTAARQGDARLATDVFRILGKRTHAVRLHQYEALLESYLTASDMKTALRLLSLMNASGVPPTEGTTRPLFVMLLQAPSLPASALDILHSLRESGRAIDACTVNCIIESFIHHGDLASAIETYNTIHVLCPQGPSTATFNALFRGCSQAGRKDLAMFLASEMVAMNVAPDALTYDRLILVCLGRPENFSPVGDFEDAWRYLKEMRGMEWWPRSGTISTFVKRCCKTADQRVWGLLDEMELSGVPTTGFRRTAQENWRGTDESESPE